MQAVSRYTNRQAVRARIRRLMLNTIKKSGSISQNEICRKTGIRPATIINFLNELRKEGYVRDLGPGESTGGRPPRLLGINPAARCVIGLHFDGIKVKGVLTDLNGEIIGQVENEEQILRENVMVLFSKVISGLINKIRSKKRILGIGLGVPGLVDQAQGIGLSYVNFPWWRNIRFKSALEDQFLLGVEIENDTKVLTLAEKWYGQGRGVDNFLHVDMGTGIALGIFLDNRLYKGSGKAGEFGHTTIELDGPLCRCGRRGCLEAMASSSVLQREAGNISLGEIIEKARAGDQGLLEIFSRIGRYFGLGIVNLINIFDPSLIILGGELAQAGDLILAPVKSTVKGEALNRSPQEAVIALSKLGPWAGARGAAALILGKFFDAD